MSVSIPTSTSIGVFRKDTLHIILEITLVRVKYAADNTSTQDAVDNDADR